MIQVVGIKFKKNPKIYYFSPEGFAFSQDCGVLVETARGLEYGICVSTPFEIEKGKIVQPLKPVVRIATDEDKGTRKQVRLKAKESIKSASKKAEKYGLSMRVSDAEYTFDGSKLIL
ncbi:MAG: stage 0 sporulation protein, partial [Firmicutes bacterium]|nr:stage 0 sporulation protein [Bacillota bacterium]